MNTHQPLPLSSQEWEEIAALSPLLELWQLPADMTGQELAANSYGVKFDFLNEGAGPIYIGDLFIIHTDRFVRPILLIRDERRRLRFLEYSPTS